MGEPQPSTPCCCEEHPEHISPDSRRKSAAGDTNEKAELTDQPWIDGSVRTPAGDIPRVVTRLGWADRAGTWKVRCGIGRDRYRVAPGLYAVGRPTADSVVLVSANYKLSFDRLRSQLSGLDAWILVLDTRGVNVWCAAGKGTFGTDEIVARVESTRLDEIVSYRQLIVPQLGAPGVSAHEVEQRCGFGVIYGPVRAEDLPAFLAAGMKATPEMRRVRFPLRDRLVLIPTEIVQGTKYALLVAACLLLLAGLGPGVYSLERVATIGVRSAALSIGTFVAAVVLTPTLLPWLPGRSFSAKGAWLGLVLALAVGAYMWTHPTAFVSWLSAPAWLLMILAITSFVAMNYTGTSTYTSLSGVKREMRVAVPLQIACAVIGVGAWLAGRFF